MRRTPLQFTDAQEEDVVEWVHGHELLYNKDLRAYQNTGKKNQLWMEKGQQIGIDGENFFYDIIYNNNTCNCQGPDKSMSMSNIKSYHD